MKNDQTMKYTGIVQITVKNATGQHCYTMHNNGTPALFKLISMFLAQATVLNRNMPAYVMLRSTEDVFMSKVPVISSYEQDAGGEWVTRSSCSTPKSNIQSGKTGPFVLNLLSANNDEILASVDIGDEIYNAMSGAEGTVSVVDWNLKFTN